MRKILVFVSAWFLAICTSTTAMAQCAMCRSTVVSNVSNGEQLELAASLNTGIVYLFVMPYLLAAVIGFLWYKSAKPSRAA